MKQPRAANDTYRLPPPLFDARCKACWFTVGLLVLVVASFWSLDLQWAQFFSAEAAASMGRFVGEFFPPDTSPAFLHKVAVAAWETLAMSAVGTMLAAIAGLALLHFFWMRAGKQDFAEVAVYAVIFALLLGWRLRRRLMPQGNRASSRI